MNGSTTDWTGLREFKSVLLTQSFVLSWAFNSDSLLLDLDLCLSQEHPFYEKPRPSEKKCIRPAIIEFPSCSSVSVNTASQNSARIGDVVQSLGAGSIEGFRRTGEGIYEISGSFGTIHVFAERPILRIKATGQDAQPVM
jgi:hypothetical protein